jgi:hypothetical protein
MIVLQFVRGTELDSKLIEWFGGGPLFSHVDSVLSDGRLLGARSDAVGGAPAGVQIRSPDYVQGLVTLRVELACSDLVTGRYYDFVNSQIGKPYDKTGIMAFVFGRDWQEDDSWFCSELVASGLEKSGYFPYKPVSPSNKITPPNLILMLSVLSKITLLGSSTVLIEKATQ